MYFMHYIHLHYYLLLIHYIINRFAITIIPFLPLSFVRMIAQRYVAGESSQEALMIVKRLNEHGYSVTLDILGEHSKNKSGLPIQGI